MILRRVIDHFRKQEWTAIALDFVIVVAGILIAFQITAWNEMRRDRANEARYLAELVKDLESDIAEMDETMQSAVNRIAAVEIMFQEIDPKYVRPAAFNMTPDDGEIEPRILPALESPAEEHLHSLALDVHVLDGKASTFEELVTTGNLGILRDRSLVRALSQYYADFRAEQDGDEINRHFFLRMTDYYIDLGISPLEALPKDDFAAIVKSDKVLEGHLKASRDFGLWQLRRVAALKSQAERVLNAIHESQGVSSSDDDVLESP